MDLGELLTVLVGAGLGGTAALIVIALVFYLNPDKFEKWLSQIYKGLSKLGGFFRGAQKAYVKYDIQGRINEFRGKVSDKAPYFEDIKIAVEWTDVTANEQQFLDKGRAILRLKRDDPEDLNFVHGAYWAVSNLLLPRVKKHISSSQRQSLDLYVTSEIIRTEKFAVLEHFRAQYLDKKVGADGKIRELFQKYDSIDKYGLFYPILLQELYFLGFRVYVSAKPDSIHVEVTRLIAFLESVASRKVGEEVPLDYLGEYCRFAVVIVGKGEKLSYEGTEPYLKYINIKLRPKRVHTLYVLGKEDYHVLIDEVCKDLYQDYEIFKSYRYEGMVASRDGDAKFKLKQYLVVLRSLDDDVSRYT